MSLENRDALCVGCFLMPEKYPVPEVRGFYNETISHLIQGLEFSLHRVSNIDELENLVSRYQLTHLFTGWEEYSDNANFLESLDSRVEIIVFADESFTLPKHSRAQLIRKPFYALPLVRYLNEVTTGEDCSKENNMQCPGVKVLVVDDEPMNLMVAEGILKNYRMDVTVAGSGREAIDICSNKDFDLIFLDYMMPEMNGFELLGKIREIETCQSIPVIFLTADNDTETETRCFKEGAIDFIAKPFVPEVMCSRIGRALELEELRCSLADRLEQKTREVSDMKSKSCQDALTGLWNRVHTEETVNEMITQGVQGALMMIDMDNFKAINDNYGHLAGDKTLKMFAETLRKLSAEEDVLCRIGGDEFVVFVKGITSKAELGNRAADIISDLCYKLEQCKFETNSSVSIGIAQTPEDGVDFSKLYNCADKALYYVKQNGKNSYHFFSDKLQAESMRAGKTVDLNYLREVMSRADSGKGAFLLDFDSFHHVYSFISRFVERSGRDVQTVLFTVSEATEGDLDVTEMELVLEMLEKAIYISLRRSDVSTRYSGKQVIVILMDANGENGTMVAERILECFNKLYTGGKVQIDYGIARMD